MTSSATAGSLFYDVRLSSVGPGQVCGRNRFHEPTSMDLAMKLHYLRAVYFFGSHAARGLAISDLKAPMFSWLNQFYLTCGRFRRSESGRPCVKCNDCGVRFIEAKCAKTMDEYMEMNVDGSMDQLLVPNAVIGPELMFSPLVLIQITRFTCGGISMGLSWAHVLGDPSSASYFISRLGQVLAGQKQPNGPPSLTKPLTTTTLEKAPNPKPLSTDPLSVKRVDPVGDHWIAANSCPMGAYSFNIGPKQLSGLRSKMMGPGQKGPGPAFESICALVWRCMGRIRGGGEPIRAVTLCKSDGYDQKKGLLSNSLSVGVVKLSSTVANASLGELAVLLADRAVDERSKIEEAVEAGRGLPDFLIYGANLTFVDLGESKLYDFELKGQKPLRVSCTLDGIGDEGVVLVLPAQKGSGEGDGEGRIVTVKLPKFEIPELKAELESELSTI